MGARSPSGTASSDAKAPGRGHSRGSRSGSGSLRSRSSNASKHSHDDAPVQLTADEAELLKVSGFSDDDIKAHGRVLQRTVSVLSQKAGRGGEFDPFDSEVKEGRSKPAHVPAPPKDFLEYSSVVRKGSPVDTGDVINVKKLAQDNSKTTFIGCLASDPSRKLVLSRYQLKKDPATDHQLQNSICVRIAALRAVCDGFRSPEIVYTHVDGTDLWITTEHVDGFDLTSLFVTARFPEAMAARLALDAIDMLQDSYDAGLEFREVKSDHVFLTLPSGRLMLRDLYQASKSLADSFGVAQETSCVPLTLIPATPQARKSVVGTPYWLAPEVIRGTQYHLLDLLAWSVGLLAYEALVGEPPYMDYPPLRALFMIVRGDGSPSHTLPEKLRCSQACRDFVAAALTRDPANRPSLTQLRKHKWLKSAASRAKLAKWVSSLKVR